MSYIFSCKEVKSYLSAYFDSELSSTESEFIKNHLEICNDCKNDYESIKKQSLAIKEYFNKTLKKVPEIDTTKIINRLKMNAEISCEEVQEELSAFYDNELEEEKYTRIEKHLEKCTDCKNQLESIKSLSGLIQSSSYKNTSIPDFNKILTCKNIGNKLSSFSDGELPGEEMAQVYEHLLECRKCRIRYEKIKDLRIAVKGYFNNFEKTLPEENPKIIPIVNKKVKFSRGQKAIISTAALFLVAILTWFPMNNIKNKETEEIHIEKIKLIRNETPYYVKKAEDFFISDLYEVPSESAIALMYGK